MKKYALIAALFALASAQAEAATPSGVTPSAASGAKRSVAPSTSLNSLTSSAKSFTLTCSGSQFSVGSVTSGSSTVSVTCANITQATEAEYNSTMPVESDTVKVMAYHEDKSGKTDQWEVQTTTGSGRSLSTTTSFSNYTCPSGYSVSRVTGSDVCSKTVAVTPSLK